jgi:SAM-dependent methyltransferase
MIETMNIFRVESPPWSNPITLAHHYWKWLLHPNDSVIDATCGNGKDALYLAELLPQGVVIGIDISARAIQKSKETTSHLSNVLLFHQSHESFPEVAYAKEIKLIVYNLGYLPGSGNKSETTETHVTLFSVKKSLSLVVEGGVVSITCYPGHPEGKKETIALLEYISALPQNEWNICRHEWPNRRLAPSLLIIQKKFIILPKN